MMKKLSYNLNYNKKDLLLMVPTIYSQYNES